jgi:hypothetical protein
MDDERYSPGAVSRRQRRWSAMSAKLTRSISSAPRQLFY